MQLKSRTGICQKLTRQVHSNRNTVNAIGYGRLSGHGILFCWLTSLTSEKRNPPPSQQTMEGNTHDTIILPGSILHS
jgi:hypothetical protein